jgi:hypothetical protein
MRGRGSADSANHASAVHHWALGVVPMRPKHLKRGNALLKPRQLAQFARSSLDTPLKGSPHRSFYGVLGLLTLHDAYTFLGVASPRVSRENHLTAARLQP